MPLERLDVEWLVWPLAEGEGPGPLARMDAASDGEVGRALGAGEFKGTLFEFQAVPLRPGSTRARKVVLAGAGPASAYTPDVARDLATASAIHASERRARTFAFVHRVPDGAGSQASAGEWAQAVSEGLTLGDFDTGRYKAAGADRPPRAVGTLASDEGEAFVQAAAPAAARGCLVAQCVNLARDLVNEPGNLLPPRVLAERAQALVSGAALGIEILDEHHIRELGLRLVAAVGQGSHEPPRVVVIRHDPPDAASAPVLGVVGKGVTFDTGGLSIKTADGMERMKDDMAGGAAVLAAMRAIALLRLPIRVLGVVVAAENMPGGGAMRPGDVLRAGSGRTVEVVNTDAEGRLLLADGLWHARQAGATHLVDVATLTGACTVALGRSVAGVFGRPDAWRERVRDAAARCGERVWPLPLVEEERDQLKSEIADTINCGGRHGGAITAALFVGEFAGDCPWAHLDIAGPAWTAEAKPHLPKGPTGFGVRTIVALASRLSEER
jgi:leucyl aminopeptidase